MIDTQQWNALIGKVPHRPSPPGIEAFLRRPCSLFSGKTNGEAHVWIDIPPTVDDQPLTLNRMRHFAARNRANPICLNIYFETIIERLGDVPIPEDWYGLLRTCLPGTKNKTFQEQLEVLARHPEYMAATFPQVLVASLMEYIRSGGAKTRLFEEEYAYTSTIVDGGHIGFGSVDFAGWPRVVSFGDFLGANLHLGLAVVLRPQILDS